MRKLNTSDGKRCVSPFRQSVQLLGPSMSLCQHWFSNYLKGYISITIFSFCDKKTSKCVWDDLCKSLCNGQLRSLEDFWLQLIYSKILLVCMNPSVNVEKIGRLRTGLKFVQSVENDSMPGQVPLFLALGSAHTASELAM